MRISFSLLKVMKDCPHRAVAKSKVPDLLTVKGRIVHRALEDSSRYGGSVSDNLDFSLLDGLEYVQLAESTLKRYGASNQREYLENQIRICASYLDSCHFGIFSVFELELSATYKGHKVTGTIDVYDDGHVLDIKTSQATGYADPLQMAMYKFLLEANSKAAERFTFLFPLLGKSVDVEPDMPELYRLMDRYVMYAENGHSPAFPANCNGCVLDCPLLGGGRNETTRKNSSSNAQAE